MAGDLFQFLFDALPSVRAHHRRESGLYALLNAIARAEVERCFSAPNARPVSFGPFGELVFPFHNMGAVDSLNLFDLDELILFSFYWINRGRYDRVADIGANLGLHSILLRRCGYKVRAYEPDPNLFARLRENLRLNGCEDVEAVNAAVSSKDGRLEFTRVLGNMTASHLTGSKPAPSGKLERFDVDVRSIKPVIDWAELLKIDVEGHEAEILVSTNRADWSGTDALIEIGDADNAEIIFDHFSNIGVGLFAQRRNWQQARTLQDVPTSYREGMLFVSCRPSMPWDPAPE